MKLHKQKTIVFAGKSLVWSILLYVSMMLAFNWEDVRNTVAGNSPITVVKPAGNQSDFEKNEDPSAKSITTKSGLVNNVIMILKTIGGITTSSTK